MGLFCLPKDLKDPTPEQLVDAAIANLKLWKECPDRDYLIYSFAMKQLNEAMTKLRPLEMDTKDDTVRSVPNIPSD